MVHTPTTLLHCGNMRIAPWHTAAFVQHSPTRHFTSCLYFFIKEGKDRCGFSLWARLLPHTGRAVPTTTQLCALGYLHTAPLCRRTRAAAGGTAALPRIKVPHAPATALHACLHLPPAHPPLYLDMACLCLACLAPFSSSSECLALCDAAVPAARGNKRQCLCALDMHRLAIEKYHRYHKRFYRC